MVGCVEQVSKHRYSSNHTAKISLPSPDEEEDEASPEPEEAKDIDAAAAPRREGLRPRQGIRPPRLELSSQDYEDDDQNSSDREMGTKGESGNHRRCALRWPLGVSEILVVGSSSWDRSISIQSLDCGSGTG